MEIVKLLKDYSKTPLEQELSEYFTQEFDCVICREPIKNKQFMLEYIKPINDLIISNIAPACADYTRLLY